MRKNRNGPIDTVELAFLDKYASFQSISRADRDLPRQAADDDGQSLVDAVDG